MIAFWSVLLCVTTVAIRIICFSSGTLIFPNWSRVPGAFFEDESKGKTVDAIVMHPGPMNRGVEIDGTIADDINRSVIQTQVEMGVAVRMAAMDLLARNLRARRGAAIEGVMV